MAQTANPPANLPSAGEVVREMPVAPAMPALPAQQAVEAQGQVAPAPAVRFVLKEFHLRGNTVLTPFQISGVTDAYIGRSMAEQDLARLMAAIRQRYQDQGYTLVSLGFPEQDVAQGVLTIDVVEPRLGRVETPASADAPVTQERIRGLMSFFNVQPHGLLNTAALERVMFALNDMPGVQAKAALSPAGDEGAYNLSIQTQPRRRWDASMTLDNQGSRSAGRWRLSGLGRINNVLGMGDNLDVQALFSTGAVVKVGRVAYEMPVGYTPARLSVAFAKVAYDITEGEFGFLEPQGSARVIETNLSYPLMRSRSRTLMARIGADQKNLRDEYGSDEAVLAGLGRQDKRIHSVSAALNFESRDAWLGGGFNGASAVMRWGQLHFNSGADREDDAADGIYGKGGRFTKVELQLSRLQAIVPGVSLFASVSQQLASRNLDPAEKMTLGGPRGVRAYPTAEGASDEGTVLNTELRYWINPSWTVFALYDWAKGYRSRKVDAINDSSNEIYLRGAGLGVAASYPGIGSLKATVAWRGPRPVESDAGNDKVRLFLQAQHAF
ncbi:MAG: ShlB/FhaC/HecB family hemolysin secretion/activation protein [Aquabacterium sp.]